MTNIPGLLSVATKALTIQQRAIHVTGNNIANVNTPGYSRQRLNISSDVPVDTGFGALGTGVTATGIERVYEHFLGVQINNETQNLGRWEAHRDSLQNVETIFSESGGYGLNQVMSEFWNAWQDVTNNPSGSVERTILLAKSEMLATTISKNYDDLKSVQHDIDTMITGAIGEINRLSEGIFDLNLKIVQMESGGNAANDYRDQRDVLLKELSELIEVNSFEDANGAAIVSVGSGQVLVEASRSYDLSTQVNASGLLDITWLDSANNTVTITNRISGGKLKGWLDTRDLDIRNALNRLDLLAQRLMEEVNTVHQAGYGLDGSTGNDFFVGAATAGGVMDSVLTITAEQGGAGNISISLVPGGSAGSETVTTDPITGDIRVAIEDGVSTRAQIAAAIQGHPAVASVVPAAPSGTPWTLGTGADSVTLSGGASAVSIQVNPLVANDVNLIAAAASFDTVPGDKPGDNGNAIAIANLQNALTMNGNTTTFGAFYGSMVSDIGHAVQQADAYRDHQSQMVLQLENQRESISGVSIDEEMVNLVKFQNAYQAAAKLITTADEMLETVLNIV